MIRRVAVLIVIASTLGGQPRPGFEVASVKEHTTPLRAIYTFSGSGPRVHYEGYNFVYLVMEAYKLKRYQVVFPGGQPSDTWYDIDAKAEGSGMLARDDFRPMLRSLLTERFNLQVHHEQKEMPVYALVLGKGGPKFHESAPDAEFHANHGVNGRMQNLVATKFTMDMLAEDLGLDRPVIDRTGLTGAYDIRLEATPEFRIQRDPDPSDLSTFDAVQSQLGLKLEAQKAMIDVVVIDRMQKPTAN